MNFDQGRLSPSGVQIAADFRDNLIIDRYDPVFAGMRASKLKHLRSADSEMPSHGTSSALFGRSRQRLGYLRYGSGHSHRRPVRQTMRR